MELITGFFRFWTLLLAFALALLLPFGFIVGPLMVLMVGCWLLSGGWKEKLERMKAARFLWIWIAFFLLNVLSLLWTSNQQVAMSTIKVQLPLLFVPLVISTISLNAKQTRWMLSTFLLGLLGCGLFMLGRAAWLYFAHDISRFYYDELAEHIMHPSYLAMYFCVGILLLFHGVLLQSFPPKPWKFIAIALTLFYVLIIFLLASKSGILAMVVLLMGYIVYSIIRFKRYAVGIAALAVIVIGFFAAMKFFPRVGARVQHLEEFFASHKQIDPADVESNNVRVLIWEADYALASRHPLTGVGIGDVQDSLMAEYHSRGMTGAMEKKLNAHSQLFQTTIAVGIGGLALLLLLFAAPALWAIRNQYGFLVLFACLVLLNIIPESMFQLQAGVSFFSFFYSLILFSIDKACLSPMKAPPISFT